MSKKFALFFVLVLGYWSNAFGVIPENGLWWNPAESGRGYGIEIQDDFMFITYYAYGPNGTSTFFTSGGAYSATTSSATMDLISLSNGQCFGCAYQGFPSASVAGTARVVFNSRMRGTLYLPNGTNIPIQRQLFTSNEPRVNLYGTWHLTSGALGIYFGDGLWIQSAYDSIQGGFSGRVLNGSTQRILVGSPMDDGKIAILVDSSTSYYTFYVFDWSVNFWTGREWTYLKTQQLSGSGLQFYGSRLLGKKYSEQGVAAGASVPKEFALDPIANEERVNSLFALRASVENSNQAEFPEPLPSKANPVNDQKYRDFAASLSRLLSAPNSNATLNETEHHGASD